MLQQNFGYYYVQIFLLDPVSGDLVFKRGSDEVGTKLNGQEFRLPRGKGIIGYVVDSGETVLVSDVTKDDRHYHDAIQATGITTSSLVAVPLNTRTVQLGAEMGVEHTRIIGGLEAINKLGGVFNDEDAGLLRTLASQAATVLQIAKLYGDANELFLDTIQAMVASIDSKDPYTNGHSQRVSDFSTAIGRRIDLPPEQLHHLRIGALLHDIGKMGVPDRILLKEGPLTEDEWILMRQHPGYAHDMLRTIQFLRPALDIPYCHHEKWDGTGYPRQLKGDEIPLVARIFAVVDVWDALTSDRPYRPAWSRQKALSHIREHSGQHFDPHVVEKFIALIDGA